MTPSANMFTHLKGFAQAVFLIGCLSLLAFQQVGSGTRLLLGDALFPHRATEPHSSLACGSHASALPSFSSDTLAPTCEALLTKRKIRIPSAKILRSRSQPSTITVFHGNLRPVILRTRAVFCDFALLRRVLHPHFIFLAIANMVLC